MSTPTIFDLCKPRPDVLAGTSSDSDFAADLSHVIRGTGGPVEYSNPPRFFANTYPTRGLKSLLANVCTRLSGRPGAVAAIFRLDTSFDGENADPANGRRMGNDVLAFTPWGEIAYALAGPKGYERLKKSDQEGIAP